MIKESCPDSLGPGRGSLFSRFKPRRAPFLFPGYSVQFRDIGVSGNVPWPTLCLGSSDGISGFRVQGSGFRV